MKKIPTIFKRNPENMSELLDEPHPDCLWVFEGEGVATRKYDGTCCLIMNGKLYKRREYKQGKSSPDDFIQADYDSVTGKSVGWLPVYDGDAGDKWHLDAFRAGMADGTYELVGPKVQGNPEKYQFHTLIKHGGEMEFSPPRDIFSLRLWLDEVDIEGIVYYHQDGRMGKIKKSDFGLTRQSIRV